MRDPASSDAAREREEAVDRDESRPRLALVPEDSALLGRIRAGDHTAFEVVYRAYFARLCDFADGYLRSPAMTQDVVQDVLCALWADRERLRVTTTLERYLHGAVRNKCLNVLRHAVIEERAATMLTLPEGSAVDAGLEGGDLYEERASRLEVAIAQLPASRLRVLQLRWGRGLSYVEIAGVLGTSVKAVELQLYRTLRSLRQLVSKS